MKKTLVGVVLLFASFTVHARVLETSNPNLKFYIPPELESGFPELTIDGACVSNDTQAVGMVREYLRRMDEGKITDVLPKRWEWFIVDVKCDVPEFCKKGEQVWEVRLRDEGHLSAVVWVHPDTAKLYTVYLNRDGLKADGFGLDTDIEELLPDDLKAKWDHGDETPAAADRSVVKDESDRLEAVPPESPPVSSMECSGTPESETDSGAPSWALWLALLGVGGLAGFGGYRLRRR